MQPLQNKVPAQEVGFYLLDVENTFVQWNQAAQRRID